MARCKWEQVALSLALISWLKTSSARGHLTRDIFLSFLLSFGEVIIITTGIYCITVLQFCYCTSTHSFQTGLKFMLGIDLLKKKVERMKNETEFSVKCVCQLKDGKGTQCNK